MEEQTTTKPGWKTTEFWLRTLSVLLGILMGSGIMDNADSESLWVRLVGALITCVSAAGYSVDRRKVKVANSQATGSGDTDG